MFLDVKVRDDDPVPAFGRDDVVLEIMSCCETGTPGWTVDGNKRTHLILWLWTSTGRYYLVHARKLREVTLTHGKHWLSEYKNIRNSTRRGHGKTYSSLAVCVPRKELEKSLGANSFTREGILK